MPSRNKKLGFSFLVKKGTNRMYFAAAALMTLVLTAFAGFTLYSVIRTLNIIFQQPAPDTQQGLVRFDLEAASRIEKLSTSPGDATLETTAPPLPSPVPTPLSTPSPSPET